MAKISSYWPVPITTSTEMTDTTPNLFMFCSSQRHLEEISRLTQSRDDAVEDLETARSEMAKMKAMGTEMIRNLQQQVAELEGMTSLAMVWPYQYIKTASAI